MPACGGERCADVNLAYRSQIAVILRDTQGRVVPVLDIESNWG
jgi:hypothetical protein